MLTREAADRGAAAPGLALIAGLCSVVEIRTAGALEQVASGSRLVTELAGGAGQQRTGQQAIAAPYARIGSERGIAHRCAYSQTTIGRAFDLVEAETVDVHQMRRRLNFKFH